MEITGVKVTPANNADRFKAYVEIKFDNCFTVKGLRLIEGNYRWFVAMPDKKMPNGTYIDLAHPLNVEFRDRIEAAVMTEYKKVTEKELAA